MLIMMNHSSSVMVKVLPKSVVDHEQVTPCPQTIELVFVASLLSMQH